MALDLLSFCLMKAYILSSVPLDFLSFGLDLASTLVFNKKNMPAPWAQSWQVEDTLDTQNLGYTYV